MTWSPLSGRKNNHMKTIQMILAALLVFSLSACDPDDECICYEIYAPVCGCDGVEYANDCFAECAGVTFTEGKCPLTKEGRVLDTGPVAADGCDWVILIDSTQYHPEELPAAFQQNDLEVLVKYQLLPDTFFCGWAVQLPVIEVLQIEEL